MNLPIEPMAFPSFVEQYDYGFGTEIPKSVSLGMTLRDYFAAKAMQGLMARIGAHDAYLIAHDAYIVADAMLKEREA